VEAVKQEQGGVMKHVRVLNLGAGVQSSAIYVMMCRGEIEPADYAIFADTKDEPAAVYDNVQWLRTLGGPLIHSVSAGSLGDNLIRGVNSTGQRFVAIPSFLSTGGIGRRQCTKEYKLMPIEFEIRRMLGLAKGERIPKDVQITQVFGLSFDEPKRVARVRDQFRTRKNWDCEFPLFDEFITRADCLSYLKNIYPNIRIPRSACVYCPYHSDDEWLRMKTEDPDSWARAVEIDNAIRDKTSVCTRGMDAAQYLHRSCVPLELVELKPSTPDPQKVMNWSQMDCEGMCGH
jgi:hypothetical protein